ncbi:MAG: enoyl-CoA hydratase [Dehalococcoidia bacterium]
MADDVLYELREPGIGWITLNRPESLNAMGGDLIPMLGRRLAEAGRDPAVRVVVITGAGRGFCSGGDVRGQVQRRQLDPEAAERAAASAAMGAPLPPDIETRVALIQSWHMMVPHAIHTLLKPVVAMVNGAAAGAGMSVALACDIRIASDRAKFTTAFRNVGLSGDFGGSYFLTRLAGDGVARELYFSGAIIEAAEAYRIGIVNKVVPHDELEAATMAFVRQLSHGPTGAYARMKRQLNLAAHADLRTVLETEALHMTLSGLSPDAKEAGRAFVEKRPPRFE